MTFEATIHHAGMIENTNLPRNRLMALRTIITGANVCGRFAGRMQPIMTGFATLYCIFMIKMRNYPGGCHMAIFASL